eukprot:scaffold12543_cov22-Tisochrysis_lutea.AAC.1
MLVVGAHSKKQPVCSHPEQGAPLRNACECTHAEAALQEATIVHAHVRHMLAQSNFPHACLCCFDDLHFLIDSAQEGGTSAKKRNRRAWARATELSSARAGCS